MVEEKVVRRGEVWWIDAGISVGAEEKSGRPGVIISSDTGNEKCPTVIVAYTTTQRIWGDVNQRVVVAGRTNRVRCNQLFTVDKSRLTKKIGTLSAEDMASVDTGVAIAVEIQSPKQGEPADVVALRSECDMWRRMYEKVLDQLVDMRVAADMALLEKPPVVEQKPPVVKHEKPPVAKKEELLPVDINHCSELVLRELGLSDADVASVIACRPYESILELNCVPDLDTGWVAANEHRFVCTPIVTETPPVTKVNINTCQAKDLIHLGMDKNRVYKITSDRKRNGAFLVVGDLTRVAGIGQTWLDQWIDKLEV